MSKVKVKAKRPRVEAWRAGSAGSADPEYKMGHVDQDDYQIDMGTGKRHAHDPPIIRRREANGNRAPMRFVSLHHHSTFSYLDGYQLPEAHIRRAQELQMPAIALTEHGNTDSHVKFEKAAEGTGVKPIYGFEAYMPAPLPEEGEWFEDVPTQRKYHLTILATGARGYRSLMALTSEAWLNFYYEPTVTWESLLKHKQGLVVLSGCQGSVLFCSTVGGKSIEESDASYARGLAVAREFKRELGDAYYIEVQAFPELEKTCAFNSVAGQLAREVGCRLVATVDAHYTVLEEQEVQKILHNLRPGEKRSLEEQVRDWGYDVPLCPPPDDRSIYRRLRKTGLSKTEAIEAIQSTADIASGCNVALPKLPMTRFPVPQGFEDARVYWRHQLREGWKFRGMSAKPRAYRERAKRQLRHEMQLIESKDFIDYFLMVQAGVVHVKGNGVPVGPARGSAAASIAAWLLRITEVNPLEFPYLRFDRFISEDRWDFPDIDLDFPGDSRPMLRRFYEDMLGPGCVNNVGTFAKFKGKNSLDDVARVFHVPRFEIETVKNFLIERSSGDLRASATIEETVEQFSAAREVFERHPELRKSALLEGNVKSFGVHAGGLILSNEPITKVAAVVEREVPKGSGNVVQVIPLDKRDAERQGMIKMDFLGLSTMQMLWDAVRMLGMPLDDLYNLPLDDPLVYDGFQRNDHAGIFQFDGEAGRYVGSAVRPVTFPEIMDCIALCHPGPLHNGGAKDYADIKHGRKEFAKRHPAIAEITASTKNQIIYQEQVLDLLRIIGNFDRVAVSDARRIISDRKGEQIFSRMKKQFLEGAKSLARRTDYPAISAEEAATNFGDLITAGAYAFNAAHSAGYGLIAYWTQWLKQHEPTVFYASSLIQATKDPDKTRLLIRDAALGSGQRKPVKRLPPHPRRSRANWQPVSKRRAIRPGFANIHGIGSKTAQAIIDAGGLETWDDLLSVRGIGHVTVERIKAFAADDDPFDAFRRANIVQRVRGELERGELGDLPRPTHLSRDIPQVHDHDITVTWLGMALDRNVRDIFEENMSRRGEALDPAKVQDPHLNEWAMLRGMDDCDERVLIAIDRWRYPKFKEAIFNCTLNEDLLLVGGVKSRLGSTRKLKVKRLWVISP